MVYISSALVAIVLSSILDGVQSSCGHGTSYDPRVVELRKRQEGGVQKVVEVKNFGYIGTQGP
jgi:hypothetical protein